MKEPYAASYRAVTEFFRKIAAASEFQQLHQCVFRSDIRCKPSYRFRRNAVAHIDSHFERMRIPYREKQCRTYRNGKRQFAIPVAPPETCVRQFSTDIHLRTVENLYGNLRHKPQIEAYGIGVRLVAVVVMQIPYRCRQRDVASYLVSV